MSSLRAIGRFLCVSCILSLAVCSAHAEGASSSPQKKTTHHASTKKVKKASHRSRRSRRKPSWKRTQQIIAPDRAQEIQEALVREHYLKGEPSGVWDSSTQSAMQHYQADHGWQTKVIPDSRALIALGLGPDHQHLLNPESAMTSGPESVEPKKSEAPKSSETPAVGPSTEPVNSPAESPATAPPDAPASAPSTPSPATINDQN